MPLNIKQSLFKKNDFWVKDPQLQLRRSIVAYRLNCSCESFYIGQTQRNLVKFLEEHQLKPNSEVCNHLQPNPTHKVDFHNQQILSPSAQTNTNF